MEYTIKQGDTLSQIAKLNNTTVDALAKANTIADPNKIIAGEKLILPEVGNINKNIDISTNEITPGIPDLNTPTLEVKPDTTANAILDYTTNEQLRIAEEKKKLEEVAKTSLGATTGTESLVELAQKTPTIDTSTIRTQQEQVSGATQLREDIALQSTKLAGIKGERDKLDIMEQNEIEALEKAGITRGAIDREKTVIERRYASKKAKLSADLNAEASMLAAMQGNYTMAKEVADQAVEDYVYDYKQKVENFNNVFDIYSDLVNDLNDDEKEILKTAAENAQKELDNAREEKKNVLSLRLDYPNAGILATDTLDQATSKVEKYQIDNPKTTTPDVIGSSSTGYMQWNPKTGNWESISGTVESAKNIEINKDVAEFVLKLDTGAISWGTAFDAMKAAHPELSNEQIDNLLNKEKRYTYEASGDQLSQWETEGLIWRWLSSDGANKTSEEKKKTIMSAGLNPETFGIYY